MKCKDCIHYEAHKHFYFGEEDFDEYFNDDNVESQCPEFEDKREWEKLPCKVGETVYRVCRQKYDVYGCGMQWFEEWGIITNCFDLHMMRREENTEEKENDD